MSRFRTATLLLPLLALPACDETDVVSVRIRLSENLSGTLTTSALAVPATDSPIQHESQGTTWESRVSVLCAAGRFDQLSAVKLADMAFSAGEGGEGVCFVRVLLPRGEEARWHKALVPLSAEERVQAAAALAPSGQASGVGETLKIEVELPRSVVGNGLTGKTRGMKATSDGSVATLLVPLDTARTQGDPIVWHLTWQK